MPRPRKDSIRRWSRHGVDGYVKDVNGRAVSFIGHSKKALGFPFVESNRVRALDLHAARVNAERTRIVKRRLGIVDETTAANHTVGDLMRRYVEMKISHKSVTVIGIFETVASLLLKGVGSLPLSESDEIARLISKNVRGPARRHDPTSQKNPPLSPQTARDYLKVVRSMFTFGVQLGWATRNPVDIIEPPKMTRDRSAHVGYRAVPLDAAREAIKRAYAFDERAALCLELVLLTAMRDHEVREMRIDQVRADSIEVIGKGAARMPGESSADHRRRKPRRIVPLWDVSTWPDSEVARWQRRIREVVTRAVEIARPTAEGWLFPAILNQSDDLAPMSAEYVRKALRFGLEGVVDDPLLYSQHGLRKTAEYYMETVLEFDPVDFCDITGHDITTYIKRYRQRRTAGDIMRSVARAAGIEIDRTGQAITEATKLTTPIDRTHPNTGPQNRG